MKWRLGALGVVTALAMTSLVVVAPAESAPRTWPKIAVSRDGRTWSSHLSGPLFPRSSRLVPGGVQVSTFRVRNQTTDRATLEVSAVVRDGAHVLRRDGFHLDLKTPGKRWTSVVRSGTSSVFRVRAQPGRVRKIFVRARLDPRAGNELMHRTLPFSLRLRMTAARGR